MCNFTLTAVVSRIKKQDSSDCQGQIKFLILTQFLISNCLNMFLENG